MLNIGGELAFVLQDIDYSSKKNLLDKLRSIRDDLKNYDDKDRNEIRPILAVSIQQAFYSSNWELMKYKDFLNWRKTNEQGQNKSVN